MTKIVLLILLAFGTLVACGEDKKDPYSSFESGEWKNSIECGNLSEDVVRWLWVSINDNPENEFDTKSKRARLFSALYDQIYYVDYAAAQTADVAEFHKSRFKCLEWLYENTE